MLSSVGNQSWECWKAAIMTQYTTSSWKRDVKAAMKEDTVDLDGAESAVWVNR